MQDYNKNESEASAQRFKERTSALKNRIAVLMQTDPEGFRIKRLQDMLSRMEFKYESGSGHAN